MSDASRDGLNIHDLVNGNIEYIDDYLTIYRKLFPQYVRYIPVMRYRASLPLDIWSMERWHQWLLSFNGQPVGIAGFLYNRHRNIGLLMDFAVLPDTRSIVMQDGVRFAQHILRQAIQTLIKDASDVGQVGPLCMAAEVEHRALLKRYISYGYVEYAVEYFEPPSTPELVTLSEEPDDLEKIGYGRMHIGAFPVPGSDVQVNKPNVIKAVLNAFLVDHYKLPLEHWLTQKLLEDISEKETKNE